MGLLASLVRLGILPCRWGSVAPPKLMMPKYHIPDYNPGNFFFLGLFTASVVAWYATVGNSFCVPLEGLDTSEESNLDPPNNDSDPDGDE